MDRGGCPPPGATFAQSSCARKPSFECKNRSGLGGRQKAVRTTSCQHVPARWAGRATLRFRRVSRVAPIRGWPLDMGLQPNTCEPACRHRAPSHTYPELSVTRTHMSSSAMPYAMPTCRRGSAHKRLCFVSVATQGRLGALPMWGVSHARNSHAWVVITILLPWSSKVARSALYFLR